MQKSSVKQIIRTMCVVFVAVAAAVLPADLYAGLQANYQAELPVANGDKIRLAPGCYAAEFELMDSAHQVYKRGKLNSSFYYFPVYLDGYVGVLYGNIRVTTRARGAGEPDLVSFFAADLDGDRLADPNEIINGEWYAWLSRAGYQVHQNMPDLEKSGGTFLGADFDGDGLLDCAMVVGSQWYLWSSSAAYAASGPFDLGVAGDVPMAADFDGDGLADPALAVGDALYVWLSRNNYQPLAPFNPGIPLLTPACGDLDGDGLADLASLVDGSWYVLFSRAGYQPTVPFDLRVPGFPLIADFDGDGKGDPAVRAVNGTWHIWLSGADYYHVAVPLPTEPLGRSLTPKVAAMIVGEPAAAYAFAHISDGINDITDAIVRANDSLLRFGMELVLTNNGQVTTNFLPLYHGQVAGAAAGSLVRLSVTNSSGQQIYQSAAYAIPGQIEMTAPTEGQILPLSGNVNMVWTKPNGADGFYASYIAPDNNDPATEQGLYNIYVPSSVSRIAVPSSNLVAGAAQFKVSAMAGDVDIFERDVDPDKSFLIVATEDSVTASIRGASGTAAGPDSLTARQGLIIAKEYSKTEQGLRFTVRESNPEQITQAGTVRLNFEMRRFKMSVAFVKAYDMSGKEYYSWEKKRIFKSKKKKYEIIFGVQPGTTIVIGTHDASYQGGSYN